MNMSVKKLVAACAIALASTAAMAQNVVTVPNNPYVEPIPNMDTDNGALIITIFSVNYDAAPWSYATQLGLRMDDVLMSTSDFATEGKSLSWVLPDLAPLGNAEDLRWHVSAGDGGNNQNAFSARFLTTTLDDTVSTLNGVVVNANNAYFNFVSNLNAVDGTPDIVTDPADPRYATQFYGTTTATFPFFTGGSVTDALAFHLMTNAARGGTGQAQIDRYESENGVIGRWTLDIETSTLSWNVAGSTAPVPLPAAAWLLLSGLAGLGVVGRRRGTDEVRIA